MIISNLFWQEMQQILWSSKITIDRPKGTSHPRYPEKIYPLDYGYLEGTRAGDNAGIDVWIGTTNSQTLTGILCTLDTIKKDAEIKLLCGCSQTEVDRVLTFLGKSMQWIFLEKPQGDIS